MSAKNRIYETLFCFLLGTVYAYAMARAVLSGTILEVDLGALLQATLVMMLVWSLLFYNRYTLFVSLGGAALTGVILLLVLWRQEFEAEWFLNLQDGFAELMAFLRAELPYRDTYSWTLALILAFMVTLLTAMNLRVQFGFYILILAAVGAFSVPLYMEWGNDETAILLMAFCFLILLVKKLNLFAVIRDQYGEKSNGAFALSVIPLSLVVFAAAWLMPKPDVEAIKESGMPDVAGLADNLLYGMMPDQVFSWSDEGNRLGGPRNPNDTYIMEVDAPERLYLAGTALDRYTGTTWERTLSGEEPLEEEGGGYSAGVYPEALDELHHYYMRYYAWGTREATVLTGDVRTKTIYTPPFSQRLSLETAAPARDPYGMLRANSPLPKQERYTVSYIGWDTAGEYFAYIQREMAQGMGANGMGDQEAALYLALPDNLPERVREKTREVTANAYTDYDKLAAIRNYLLQFPYTLDPAAVPAGEDFVDYFLFEGQEGYCVYYATAMAVMGRCAGIPTRYVEGFVMPQNRNVNGNFTVTNKQSHAWAEAWFPGLGWVTYEPTPPLAQGEDPVPPEEQLEEESREELEEPSQEEPEPSAPEESSQSPVPPEPDQPDDPQAPEPPPEAPEPGETGGVWQMILLLVGLVAAAFGGLVLLGRIRTRKRREALERIDRLPHREAVISWFGKVLEETARAGQPIAPGETALAYGVRVGDAIPLGGHRQMLDLAIAFSRASYSGREVPPADRQLLRDAYLELVARREQTRPKNPWQKLLGRLGLFPW